MKHNRSEIPAYLIWVEQRPTVSGKGKKAYFDAVRAAAACEIASPIMTDDIEIEISYSTTRKKENRKDADNVNKPTLDALKGGIAYGDDRQVRAVTCAVFDNNRAAMVSGRVEYLGRLFYSSKSDVVLIMIYSDTRLLELGEEQQVQHRRYLEWEKNFSETLTKLRDVNA